MIIDRNIVVNVKYVLNMQMNNLIIVKQVIVFGDLINQNHHFLFTSGGLLLLLFILHS
jgi:hypothetical protein